MAKEALRPAQVFGMRVSEARNRLGWTQDELAGRLTEMGRVTDRATISRAEKGQMTAQLDFVVAVAAALHMPLVHMLVPLDDESSVAITRELPVPAPDARAWIRGRGLLPGEELLDVWPHLPESEKRRIVAEPGQRSAQDVMALVLGGWFEDSAINERVASIDAAAQQRKEQTDG